MNVPPPPPPPPVGTNIKSPIPASNKALLSSIEKGSKLKKVPDSLKNDRSSALVGSPVAKSSSSSQQARPINGMNMNAADHQTRQPRGFQSIQSELANQLAQFGSGSAKKPIQVVPSSSVTRPHIKGCAPPPNQMPGSVISGIRPPPPPPSTSKPMPIQNNKPGPPPPVLSNKPQMTSGNNRALPQPQPLNKKPVAPKVNLAECGGRPVSNSFDMGSGPFQQSGSVPSRRAAPTGFPDRTGGPTGSSSSSDIGSGAVQRVVRVTGNPPPPMPNVARETSSHSSRLSYPNPGLGAPPPPVPQRVTVTPHQSRAPPAPWGAPAGSAGAGGSGALPHQYTVQDRPPPPPVPAGKHAAPVQRGKGAFDRRFCFPDERQFPRWGGQAPGVPSAAGGGSARNSQALSAGELFFNYR